VRLITLLTNFGLHDTYVGQVKGAILAIAPGATVVDLGHSVPPQDVQAGAFLLWSAVEVFPRGTVHVAVVDPGVGSVRLALALETVRGDALVGPDNGLLMPAAERLGGIQRCVELNRPEFWRTSTSASATFHGRDIFGPAAAHLARGVALEHLGSPVTDVVRGGLAVPNGRHGEVLHVDTYGNLVTNIAAASLPARFQVRIGERVVPAHAYYAAVAPGALIGLVGSTGLLEISVRDGSAASVTGALRGTPVSIEPL
jgi:S-adenosylmethionine hydrolase